MYNTRNRNSGGGNQNNQYSRRPDHFQQQRQTMPQQQRPPVPNQQTVPHVATFATQQPLGQNQIDSKNHPQAIQNMPANNLSSQPWCPPPLTEPVEVNKTSATLQDNKNNIISDVLIKSEDAEATGELKTEKSEVKWPQKRKSNKKEQKKRLNARMRRLVCPKSPLMVFSELYKDVPIKLQEQQTPNFLIYTASIEIDGQVYTGDHVSKTQAKQKACENFLRIMLEKKMNERPEKKDECFSETMKVDSENVPSVVKPKGPPQEDFPWPHFASLAMHNLIAHWELQPVAKVVQEEPVSKILNKVTVGMKKFPDNPQNYNPVQLLNQLKPGLKFTDKQIPDSNPVKFEMTCDIDNISFSGQGSTKKAAKKECAIAAIKQLWNFDFNAIEKK